MQKGVEICVSFSLFVITMLKKTNFEKKNLKNYLYIPLRAHSKPKCIWLGQKLLTLKLTHIPIPMLALSIVEF